MLTLLFGFFSLLTFGDVLEAPPAMMDFEQNPSHIEWQKIDSEHFEIIFPKEIEPQAQKVTHLLEAAYPVVTRSLEVKPKRISIILQNQSTVSNGFVTLAPRRSEWYVTPAVDPELTNTEWLKTLAVHEFRHVVQFQKTRQGFNKFFEIILGEFGQALGLGLTLPPWFLEGDAVGMETALTKGGRGRLPIFERDLRALLLSGKKFNYDKAHLGSFEDYIPNHYVYGYFYTSLMREKHGDLFLSKLANLSTFSSYNPLTFYNAYHRLTGVEFEKFYKRSMKQLVKSWTEKMNSMELSNYKVLNITNKNGWTNYLYPQAVDKHTFLALKYGLSDINQFVVTDGKNEKTILYPGIMQNDYPIKLRNGRFAFTEMELDSRWGYRDYSRIKVYDLENDKYIADLRKTKGRLAVLDFKGELILYVDWDQKQRQYIVVTKLDGKEVYRRQYPRNQVITSLDWLNNSEVVMVIKDQNDLKSIVKLPLLPDQEVVTILEPSVTNLGFVTTFEQRVLIESPKSGIDNIFEVRDGQLLQLTSSRYGAYAPTIDRNELIYNDYTANGMDIVTKQVEWDHVQETSDSFVPFYQKFASHEDQNAMDQDFFAKEKFPVTKYSQVNNSLNFHSWVLLAPPLSSSITAMALSRDLLNKFSLSAGASYDLTEKEIEGFVSAAWSHYYPVFDLRGAYGGRNQDIVVNGKKVHDNWEEGTFEGGVQLPWQKITGRFMQSFSIRSFAKMIKVTNKLGPDITEIRNGSLFSPGAEMQYSIVSRLARRDLNPDWGLVFSAHIEEGKDTTGVDQRGSILAADGRVFLPGLFDQHSFFHQVGYEKQRDEFYQYSSFFTKPRGTTNVFLEEMTKYSGNYMFPVFYPDWNLSRYIYFKRVSLNVFYDEVNGSVGPFKYHAASTGWEVLLDTNFLRIFVPFTLGVRGSYVLRGNEKDHNYEFFVTTLGGYF